MKFFIASYLLIYILFMGVSFNDIQSTAFGVFPVLVFAIWGIFFTVYCSIQYGKDAEGNGLLGFLFGAIISVLLFALFMVIKYVTT